MARLLIVDDEEGLRSFLEAALVSEGHHVTLAVDGADALLKLERAGFDLVLTDLKMPRVDGMAVLHHVRAKHPGTEVIMLTAFGTVETAVEAMKAGAFDFLQDLAHGGDTCWAAQVSVFQFDRRLGLSRRGQSQHGDQARRREKV